MVLRIGLAAALACLQGSGHSDDALPEIWLEAMRHTRDVALNARRLNEGRPLPATPPAGGDPEDVHIFVIGDWGTFPGTGINMGSTWSTRQWNSWCFEGSHSEKEWQEAKDSLKITAEEVVNSWGKGRPVCGSMHLECSWGKGGVSKSNRCNPDHPRFWKDHFAQQNVANVMTNLARERKPSFVVNTADNFYMGGVDSIDDQLWSMMFEELYPDESLQIPWLSSLGNHDYGGHSCDYCLWNEETMGTKIYYDPRKDRRPCSQAMIDYDTEHEWQWPSPKKVRWVLPMKGNDRFYMKTFKFPKANVTIDVFVIDTNKAHVSSQCFGYCPMDYKKACESFFYQLWTRQRQWLLPALEQSKADWKMVVGHAPPENFEASLMEEMRDRGVSVFMAGHVHQLRHDRHPSGIEAIISGSGGGYQSAGGGTSYTLHESEDYGFATIHAEWSKLTVEYYNDEGRRIWDPIVIPRVDVVQERILKKLREAAIAVDSATMKDQIAKAKEYGVDASYVNAAAMAGVKNFEAMGGMAWVHMKPRIMKSGETTFSGFLSSWTQENSLPEDWLTLFYPTSAGSCCRDLTLPAGVKTAVLCYPSPDCAPSEMASKLAEAGAAAMLFASPGKDLAALEADGKGNVSQEMPVVSIPSAPLKDLASWMSNKAESISLQLFGGEKAYQAALDGARKAGVPENVIEAAVREAEQRRAEEKLQAAMRSSDQKVLEAALELAASFGAESDLIEQAKRKLTMMKVQAGLDSVGKNCDAFPRVHELVEDAKALKVGDTTEAESCRLKLALESLHSALDFGWDCKEPLALAVAWCELAGAMDGAIEQAQKDCEAKVSVVRTSLLTFFLCGAAVLAVVAGVYFVMQKKPAQAAPRASPGGIELLEATDAS